MRKRVHDGPLSNWNARVGLVVIVAKMTDKQPDRGAGLDEPGSFSARVAESPHPPLVGPFRRPDDAMAPVLL
jgi:hypothetical protein